jgi:predicted RNase H-like HicB family nuclease
MKKIIVFIGASSNHFGAFIQDFPGVYGAGNTVTEAKENLMEGLKLFVEHNSDTLPDVLKEDFELEYHFDVRSFLVFYSKVFTKSALARMTGINQTQLSHYVSGFRNPSQKTVRKLDGAIRRLADDLSQVHFV